MAALYTREANRKKLEIEAMGEMAPRNRLGNPILAPCQKVQAAELTSE